MVKTLSSMVSLGTQAPDFSLQNVITQQTLHLQKNHGPLATVIMFICNHCPYVKHIALGLTTIANHFSEKGVKFIAINSNDQEHYPDDSPENMQKIALEYAYPFPYLLSSSTTLRFLRLRFFAL